MAVESVESPRGPAPETAAVVDPWAKPPKVPVPRRELRQLQERSDAPAIAHVAGHFGLMLLTGALIFFASSELLLLIPAMFLHGVMIVFLFAPMHECTHGTAFRRRKLNSIVGYVCGFLLLRSSIYFKFRH